MAEAEFELEVREEERNCSRCRLYLGLMVVGRDLDHCLGMAFPPWALDLKEGLE
jgi:hypothetical protein